MDDHHNQAHWLRLAAKIGMRGHGHVEPNPMVGCVIVDVQGMVVGMGHHEKFGHAHAEVNALKVAGASARGATAYVTLEPCNHTGKTRPCTQALIDAGITRVVVAALDPNHAASGGCDTLRRAGIDVELSDAVPLRENPAAPFIHRTTTGLPWVTAKWAQTIDGAIATATGDSQWISNEHSRQMVHRERGRVDTILTGIGTVLVDDPLLTARDVRVRRIARRVVIDPRLELPHDSKLLQTATEVPLTVVTIKPTTAASLEKLSKIESCGAEVWQFDEIQPHHISLRAVLRRLVDDYQAAHVLVEAGPGLVSRLFEASLANQAWIFLAPKLIGNDNAKRAVSGRLATKMDDSMNLELLASRRCADDLVLLYGTAD